MMLSRENFEKSIVPGKILYFPCEDLRTTEPHYFVCVAILPDNTILSCCTSRFDTVRKLIERNRFPYSTLVSISGEDDNPFKKDTYINCNEYFPYTVDELWNLYQDRLLSIKGNLPIHSFQQLIIGFLDSQMIEEEIKEVLPNPDEL